VAGVALARYFGVRAIGPGMAEPTDLPPAPPVLAPPRTVP